MASSPNQPDLPGPLSEPHNLYTAIRIRALVTSLIVLAALGTWLAGTITSAGLVSTIPLFATVYLYDLAFFAVLRTAGTRPDRATWWAWVRWLQQPCDVLSITYLLHLLPTGGITPLAVLYCIAILGAIIALPPWGVYTTSAFATACYTGLVVYEFAIRPLPPPYTLLYQLRTSADAARIPVNAVVMMVLAMSCIALIAGHFARRLRADTDQIRHQLADLTALHNTLREQVRRDSLTGLLHHGALVERLEAAVAEATRTARPLTLILLDVDHFKPFNDHWGHQAGDAALESLAGVLEATVQGLGAAVGRWGGEEFGIVLPNTTDADALETAARIRGQLVTTALIGPAGERWPMPTVSQGIAGFPQDAPTAAALVAVADARLYTAKAAGRDSIVAGPPASQVQDSRARASSHVAP